MAFLTGPEIRKRIQDKRIGVTPYDPQMVGPNSMDLHLGDELLVYDLSGKGYLDALHPTPVNKIRIPQEGYVLQPGVLYLGTTVEIVTAQDTAPLVEGRSSVGRLGLQVHMTAGVIDVGFSGQITLEIITVHPVKIYPNFRICQILFSDIIGDIQYYNGRYQNQMGAVPSKGHDDSKKFLPFTPETTIKVRKEPTPNTSQS